MQKQTVLYAVTCERPANGFDGIEEAQKRLFIVNYGSSVGLPVVRHKGNDFVDAYTLLTELGDRYCLDFYAPSLVEKIVMLETPTRRVFAFLATAKYNASLHRVKLAAKEKRKLYLPSLEADPVKKDPNWMNDGSWAEESFKLLHDLSLDISDVPGRLAESKSTASQFLAQARAKSASVKTFVEGWSKIAAEHRGAAKWPALPEGIDIEVPEGYVLTDVQPVGQETQLNSDGTMTVTCTFDYAAHPDAPRFTPDQTIVPADVMAAIEAEEDLSLMAAVDAQMAEIDTLVDGVEATGLDVEVGIGYLATELELKMAALNISPDLLDLEKNISRAEHGTQLADGRAATA